MLRSGSTTAKKPSISTKSILKKITSSKQGRNSKEVKFDDTPVYITYHNNLPNNNNEHLIEDTLLTQQKFHLIDMFTKKVKPLDGLDFKIISDCTCENKFCGAPKLIAEIDESYGVNIAVLLRSAATDLNIKITAQDGKSVKTLVIDFEDIDSLPQYADALNQEIAMLKTTTGPEDQGPASISFDFR